MVISKVYLVLVLKVLFLLPFKLLTHAQHLCTHNMHVTFNNNYRTLYGDKLGVIH